MIYHIRNIKKLYQLEGVLAIQVGKEVSYNVVQIFTRQEQL